MNIVHLSLFLFFISNYDWLAYGLNMNMRKERYIGLEEISKHKHNTLDYQPKSINQQLYASVLNNNDNKMIIVTGPAGTGKTLFACKRGIECLLSGESKRIVITRPLVAVEEEMGFLPGNIVKKMDPWTRPVFDIFLEYYSKNELEKMIYENVIEISPLAFMRGRTFKDTFIIADEMQNSSPNQMQMLTTRVGDGSRLVITGDLKQTDRTDANGLKDIVTKTNTYYRQNYNAHRLIHLVALENADVRRSKLVKQVIDIYDCKEISSAANTVSKTNRIGPIDFDALYRRDSSNSVYHASFNN